MTALRAMLRHRQFVQPTRLVHLRRCRIHLGRLAESKASLPQQILLTTRPATVRLATAARTAALLLPRVQRLVFPDIVKLHRLLAVLTAVDLRRPSLALLEPLYQLTSTPMLRC